MALTLDLPPARGSLELGEFLEILRKEVDSEDVDSVLAVAGGLRDLGLNHALLIDAINRNLRNLGRSTPTEEVFYSTHSFVLGSVGDLAVRGNLWPSVRRYGGLVHRTNHINHVYAYNYPHDHNFDFLTVGWYGPGYNTQIWEYDGPTVKGCVGEKVDMVFLEETSLPPGKVMFYRKGRDIHVQAPPDEMSVSLNLLVRSSTSSTTEQYEFNMDSSTIAAYVGGTDVARIGLAAEFAGEIGDTVSHGLLFDLMNSPVPRIRCSAYRAVSKLEGGWSSELKARLCSDRSAHAEALLASIESNLHDRVGP
jgi:hypothetical protein